MSTRKSNTVVGPDKNALPWHNYFMGIAQLVRLRSKDPSCKVGACIVKNNKILSTGYNGFPMGLDDNEYPWSKGDEDPTKNKYYYVVHAELNAILNSDNPVTGSTIYITKFPCNECVKAIIQSGIKEVIYDDKESDEEIFEDNFNMTSKKMLQDARIHCVRYRKLNNSINIEL